MALSLKTVALHSFTSTLLQYCDEKAFILVGVSKCCRYFFAGCRWQVETTHIIKLKLIKAQYKGLVNLGNRIAIQDNRSAKQTQKSFFKLQPVTCKKYLPLKNGLIINPKFNMWYNSKFSQSWFKRTKIWIFFLDIPESWLGLFKATS